MKTIDLAGQVWTADLAHLDASMRVWGTGEDLEPDHPDMRMAIGLDEFLGGALDGLSSRAGDAAAYPLHILVRMAEASEAMGSSPEANGHGDVVAAAVLRVLNSEVYLQDAEDLQPGTELPAVGVYAEMED